MTSPGGPSGITAPDDSVSSTGASGLATNTQTNVVNRKKAEVRAQPGWNNASGTFFDTLMGGFANGILGLVSTLFASIFGGGSGGGLLDLVGGFLGLKEDVREVREVEVPRLDNRIDELAGGVTQFTYGTSGTFTKPAGATRIQVTLVGGGAGGARYTRASRPGGGCGGWTKWYEFLAADVPASVAITVGAGGAGGTADGVLGGNGTESRFGDLLVAGGGQCTAGGALPGYGTELYYDGSGGKGGNSTDGGGPAANGGNGPFSSGGVVGAAASGADGGNGASPPTNLIGPGSGGAGGQYKSGAGDGGDGGHGGYPGGGAGGGGNYNTFGVMGNGGNGAPGAVWVRVYFN